MLFIFNNWNPPIVMFSMITTVYNPIKSVFLSVCFFTNWRWQTRNQSYKSTTNHFSVISTRSERSVLWSGLIGFVLLILHLENIFLYLIWKHHNFWRFRLCSALKTIEGTLVLWHMTNVFEALSRGLWHSQPLLSVRYCKHITFGDVFFLAHLAVKYLRQYSTQLNVHL